MSCWSIADHGPSGQSIESCESLTGFSGCSTIVQGYEHQECQTKRCHEVSHEVGHEISHDGLILLARLRCRSDRIRDALISLITNHTSRRVRDAHLINVLDVARRVCDAYPLREARRSTAHKKGARKGQQYQSGMHGRVLWGKVDFKRNVGDKFSFVVCPGQKLKLSN